jgi:hypothetical protein
MISDDTADANSSMLLRTNAANSVHGATINEASASLGEDVLTHTSPDFDDTWILIGCVYDGNADREVFVNGTMSGSPQTSTWDINPIGGAIAVGNATYSNFLDGECLVAEVGMWDVALSDAEVASLHTTDETGVAMSSVRGSDCVGYWPLKIDQSTHSNEGVDAGGTLTVQSAMPHSSDHPTIASAGNPAYYYAQQQ